MIRCESSLQAGKQHRAAAAAVVRLLALFVCCWWFSTLSSGEGSPDAPLSHRPGRLRGLATRQKSSVIRSDSKVKSSNASEIIIPGVPEQIHLALADGRPREAYAMSVSWLTWTDAKTQVFWGREVDALLESATGNSSRESYMVPLFVPKYKGRFNLLLILIIFNTWYNKRSLFFGTEY